MIRRFEGVGGLERRVAVLAANPSLGPGAPSEALARVLRLQALRPGEVLLQQGHAGSDLAFLLAGEVEVLVNDRRVAVRHAPAHVGEMSAIDPSAPRSATVRALEPTVAGWVTDLQLAEVADAHPRVWRALARELACRLRERSRFHAPPNRRPRMFLGSSVECLPVTRALHLALDHDAIEVHPWEDGTFRPSHYAVPELARTLDQCDFGVFCVGPDDRVTSRGRRKLGPRDNVVFEVGLFMGRLGHERVLLLRPRGVDLKMPSDLWGLDALDYAVPEGGTDPVMGPTAERIRRVIRDLGVR